MSLSKIFDKFILLILENDDKYFEEENRKSKRDNYLSTKDENYLEKEERERDAHSFENFFPFRSRYEKKRVTKNLL